MHDVHAVIRSTTDLPPGDGWMGPDERARVAAMRFARRRADFLLGRFTAHALLRELLGPGDDDVRAAADGAPDPWRRGAPAGVVLAISHRAGLALCAGSRARLRLGADLEQVEPRSPGFVADFFTPAEAARVSADADPAGRDELVTLMWSAKESALKALRQGLRLDTRSVELLRWGPRPTGRGWAAIEIAAQGAPFAGWWRRLGSLVATVVADAPFALHEADGQGAAR